MACFALAAFCFGGVGSGLHRSVIVVQVKQDSVSRSTMTQTTPWWCTPARFCHKVVAHPSTCGSAVTPMVLHTVKDCTAFDSSACQLQSCCMYSPLTCSSTAFENSVCCHPPCCRQQCCQPADACPGRRHQTWRSNSFRRHRHCTTQQQAPQDCCCCWWQPY